MILLVSVRFVPALIKLAPKLLERTYPAHFINVDELN